MNWTTRIATIFIALSLGITIVPSAIAIGDGDEVITKVKQTHKKTSFTGIRITSNPAETLLNHIPLKDSNSKNQKPVKIELEFVSGEKSNENVVFAFQATDNTPDQHSPCCKQKRSASNSNF